MPKNLKRITGLDDLHFITFCCYQCRGLLATVHARNLAVQILGEVRDKYGFALVGYVFMPEHVHLLIGEVPGVPPASIVQVFKQRMSRRMRGKKRGTKRQMCLRFSEEGQELRRFWQRRYYDFNIHTRAKLAEKLNYMHANPVKQKLVAHSRDWPWSSWAFYATGEGLLKMDAVRPTNKLQGEKKEQEKEKEKEPTLCVTQTRKG
jgi:putative transposase